MANTNNSVLVLSEFVEGLYSFRLTVTDDDGSSSSDLVMVTVNPEDTNQVPIANAGPNFSISLPTNTVVLNGSGSDADGTIVTYNWQKISGPSATLLNSDNATLTVTSLVTGTYIFRLSVTDDDGASNSDETRVVVVSANVNSNPVVNAGNDVIIQLPTNTAILMAEASDKDGSIISYQWEQISGSSSNMSDQTLPTLSITNLIVGSYGFRVKVTDDDGSSDYDEIKVIVEPEDVNLAPIADAGQDIQIFLPTNSANVTGIGSDNDGSIVSYDWIKISAPTVSMTNANKPTVTFADMIEGEYTFRFTVTDNDGGTAQDELKIYVTPESVNQSPTADAGDDIEIYLPDNSVAIQGGGQ